MTAEPDYADRLVDGPARGRGADLNPGNRYEPGASGDGIRLHVLGEHLDAIHADQSPTRQVPTRVLAERTNRVINRIDSPDLPFSWTLNPYRGCEHGCIYCYARPTHEQLGLSCGLDFETTIIAKPDAPRRLERELAAPSWRGEPIVLSGVTDPYQPQERERRITRGCLEVMAGCGQPVSIVTKSRLVLRDLDLLAQLARVNAARVAISLTTLDRELAAAMEPRACAPSARLDAVRRLRDAGVPAFVMVAPIVPALTDHEIPALLAAAADAGAIGAAYTMLRLPHQVKTLFDAWLRRHRPDRAEHVLAAIRTTRDGALDDPRFGRRFRGTGARAAQIDQTFKLFKRRYGLDRPLRPLSSDAFRHPMTGGQLALF